MRAIFLRMIWMVTLISMVVLLFLYLYPFSKEIHVEHNAIKFVKGNPASVEFVTVNIEGTLYLPIFKQKRFEGKLQIEGYDFTKDDYSLSSLLIAQQKNNSYMGSLTYQKEKPRFEFIPPSWILFNESFEQANIMISPDWDERIDEKKGTYIVIGADNYEKAVEVQQRLGEPFGYDFSR